MPGHLSRMFDKQCKKIGIKCGIQYAVYRPDYTSSNQIGELIQWPMSIRYDTQAARFAEPNLPGVFTYDLFLDKQVVQPGDVLCPIASSNYGNDPVITVMHMETMKATVGVMTDQIGFIAEDQGTIRYNNVRWQWAGPTFPGIGIHEQIEDSIKLPRRKAVLFKRCGIGEPYKIVKGMRLIESTSNVNNPNIWYISDVTQHHVFTMLTVYGK